MNSSEHYASTIQKNWVILSSEERPTGNTVPIVSAPTVNNVTDAIVSSSTVNNVADAIVSSPTVNNVADAIVSAPTVNNVTDAIVCAPTDVNNVADENECVTVSEINDGAQCHA